MKIAGDLWSAFSSGDAADRQRQAQREALAAQRAANAEAQGYLDPYAQAGTAALSDLANFQDYNLPGEFDASGYNVGAYLDPSMQYQQRQMERNVAASAAARGGLMSGAAAKELQNRGAQLAQTDYGNAFQRMQTDKNFAYNQYTNRFNQVRAQNQDRLSRLQNMGNMGFQASTSKANLATGLGNNIASYAQNMGNIQAQMEMVPAQTFSNVGSGLTSLGMAGYQAGMFGGGDALGSAMPEAELSQPITQMQFAQQAPYQGQQFFGTGAFGSGGLSNGGFVYGGE
jgi:hypothetical protein